MKKLLFIISVLTCISCEQVVNVDLNTAVPRLVVEASINWEKGTSGNLQTIKLTTTAGYYNKVIPKVSGAIVSVKNSSNTVFDFVEEVSNDFPSGKYTCNNFIPTIGENYSLMVIHNGQTYVAQEKLMATPEIKDIDQRNDLGLSNDEIGIKVNFIDFPNDTNFYLFLLETAVNPFPQYQITDDQFNEGNIVSWLYSNKNLKKDNLMNFTLYGVSETYHNYMRVLLSNSTGGGQFQPPPTKVKGNIINQTEKDNYALGYFRLSETDSYRYTVK
jgi:Domain of unknown function (DUF4249)